MAVNDRALSCIDAERLSNLQADHDRYREALREIAAMPNYPAKAIADKALTGRG